MHLPLLKAQFDIEDCLEYAYFVLEKCNSIGSIPFRNNDIYRPALFSVANFVWSMYVWKPKDFCEFDPFSPVKWGCKMGMEARLDLTIGADSVCSPLPFLPLGIDWTRSMPYSLVRRQNMIRTPLLSEHQGALRSSLETLIAKQVMQYRDFDR